MHSIYPVAWDVHLNTKYFLGENKSVPVSTIFCPFLLEISLSVLGCKVPKTCRYFIHDQARQGHGSIPEMTSETVLHRYFQRTLTLTLNPFGSAFKSRYNIMHN